MKQKGLMLLVLVGLLNLLQPEFLSARDAPITSAGSSAACQGAAVVVPITVTNFTSIGAITLRLDFIPAQLTFESFTNINPSIAGAAVNYVNMGDTLAKIMIIWADINALSLPDGDTLLDLNFTLASGSPEIRFNNTSNGGGDCEYADENGAVMNDIPTASFYINSTIVNLAVAAADTITGVSGLCAGTVNTVYSVTPIANATGYIWTVPLGGTIVSGSNTPSVVVDFSTSAISGIVTVAGSNTCGTGTSSSLPVTIYQLPVPAITGDDNVCAGSTGIGYTTDSAMTSYSWSVSSGGMITSGEATKTITVDWISTGPQYVYVSYANSNGCTAEMPTSLAVSVNDLPVPTITGSAVVCVDSTGNLYTTEPGMTGYLWMVSTGGTVTAGGGTADNTITISWNTAATQWISLNYSNSNGCTAATPTITYITVNPLPDPAGVISGSTSVCAGETGVPYSVPPITESSSYTWMIPDGATIASGAETNSITVNFSSAAVSGDITVTGNNSCGNGVVSPNFEVTVNPIPDIPVVTANGVLLTSSATSGNQWYNDLTGAIPDATGQTLQAFITASYWTVVTVNDCVAPESNHVYVIVDGQRELESGSFSVYPMPNDGRFTITINSTVQESFTVVAYNQLGVKIFELGDVQIFGTFEKQIDLRPVASGLYSLIFLNSSHSVMRKVLVK